MPKYLQALLASGAVLATVFVGLASWDGLTAEGSVADPVRQHAVRIVRDGWGVPHIFGKTDADVAYGLALAHAQDDFRNLEEVVAAVRGRGGAITGEDGAKVDFAGALPARCSAPTGRRQCIMANCPPIPARCSKPMRRGSTNMPPGIGRNSGSAGCSR